MISSLDSETLLLGKAGQGAEQKAGRVEQLKRARTMSACSEESHLSAKSVMEETNKVATAMGQK